MRYALIGLLAAGLSGCESVQNMFSDGPRATANLKPTQGNNASGTAEFRQVGNRVRVTAVVKGLKPDSQHGFHVHEAGDCSSGDGMSAKGHFNPLGKPHGSPNSSERHAGDLPMLRADSSGNAKLEIELDMITVDPGPTSVVGRGLIVHADPDDFKTQPTGNAGARLACAIIQRK